MLKLWSAFQATAVKVKLAVLVATVAVATMAPGAAAAQSAGCARVNAGSLDYRAFYSSGDLSSTNARYSNTFSDQAYNSIRITATSDPTGGTAHYDTGGSFAFAAGEVLTMTVLAQNITTGTVTPRFRVGTTATSAADVAGTEAAVYTDGTLTRTYTVTGSETSIGVRTVRTTGTTPSGQLWMSVTCAPVASAPTVTSVTPTVGLAAGGTTVVITGTGFAAANPTGAVKFGLTNATYTINSNTQITATAPANAAGTYDITVKTAGGTSAISAANQFTYITPGAVSITGIPATMTSGQTVTATVTPSMAPPNGSLVVNLGLAGTAGMTTSLNTLTFNSAVSQTFTVTAGTPLGAKTITYSLSGGSSSFFNPPSAASVTVNSPAPTVSSFTYGSIVAYNDGANQTTPIDLALGGDVQNSPTAYSVGSATTAQGGSVIVDGSGQATYTPPIGFRGNDSFTWTATNGSGTSSPATTTITVGNPNLSVSLTGSGTRGTALSGVLVNVADGKTPYSCSSVLASGALPAGVSINANCTITGTPTASGTFNFTVNVTDSSTGIGPYTRTSGALTLLVAAPTLTLSPAAGVLPGATAGAPYSQSFTAGAGTSPYAYTLTSGALPTGLTLTGATLSGTPTAAGTFNFTLSATDSSSAGSGGPYTVNNTYSITVSPPTITLSPANLPQAAIGAAYSQAVSAGGGTGAYAYAVTSGSLTPGLTLSPAGVITGTPTGAGAWTFTITATDSALTQYNGSAAYTLTVNAPTIIVSPTSLPGATVGAGYSQTISAGGGTAGYSYAVTAGALPAGLTLSSAGILSGTPTAGGAFNFTLTTTDSSTGAGAPFSVSRAYALTIGQGTQTIVFGALSNASLSASPLTLPASASSGLSVTFFSDTTAICTVSGTSLTLIQTGTCTVRAEQAGDGSWAAAPSVSQSFMVTPANLTISAAPATGLQVGRSYSQANPATGGVTPYTYSLGAGAFVPGTTVNTATGEVAGTPTVAGSFSYIIRVTDSQPLSADTPVTTVTIAKGDQTLAFTSTAPSAVAAGPLYTVTASATSGLGAIFTLDASSAGCVISGATVGFTAPGTCVINANQPGDPNWNAAAQVQQSFTVIANPPIAADLSGVAVAYASSGTPIDLSGSLTGGDHTSVAIVTAPAHGTVTLAGDVVTYTPAATYFGADSFTFTANGPGGTSAPAAVSLTVATPAAPTVTAITGVAVPYASNGATIALQPSGVYTSLSVASAPAHGAVTLSGTTATYTPAADYSGADSFTYTATGPGGTSAPATISLTVAAPPPPVVTPPGTPVVVPPTPAGPAQPVTVSLGDWTTGEVDGFRITTTARYGTASITVDTGATLTANWVSQPGASPRAGLGDYQLVYTPAANFMGTDTVTVVAYGPGGDSAPLTFTFQVAGKAPDLSGSTPSNGSATFSPTSTLVGGPFQGVRITHAPGFGTATVDGLDIVFTPGAANGGSTSLDYVIDLPFGASAAGRIALVSHVVPGQLALTAATVQGRPVTTRISDGQGGPFTGAAVVSVSPSTAGTATIDGAGGVYDLTFAPSGTFTGTATVIFTLTNAAGTTSSTLVVTVEARPDPALDAEVRGVASSQVNTARRFADAQINNFQRRLQDLHDGENRSSNGASLNLGFGAQGDADNDPRTALRRQVSGGRDMVDPDDRGVDRERDMLGLDLWVNRQTAAHAADSGAKGLSAAPASNETGDAPALGFWTAGSVDWGRQDARGQRDYRFTTQGVTAGVDMRLNDQLIVGAGLGYGEDKTRIGDNGSVSNGSGLTGALYASWRPAGTFYVDGVVGWSDLDFRSRRWSEGLGSDPDAYASGDRSGDARFLTASFGRVVRSEALSSQLYARVDARSISLDGFTETGAGLASLIWDGVDQESLTANLGASLRWWMEHRRLGVLRPSARVEWSHEFEDIGAQGVRYADWVASPSYLVPLDAWSRDTLRLDLGGEWSLTDRFMISLGYRGMLGDASTSHGLDITLKYGW
jgi:hypothetical protein